MNESASAPKAKKTPSCLFSLVVLGIVAAMAVFPYVLWNINMGATFLLCFVVVVPACMYLGYTYEELENTMVDYCKKLTMVFFALLACGGLIGTLIASGAVPSIVYFGLSMIHPKFFLLAAFIIPFLYAFITETRWGAMGTVGLAMMAVGAGFGINPAMTAGAVMSGAVLGDITTPISDSLLILAAITEVKPMDYFKKLIKIAIPALVITGGMYVILGFAAHGSGAGDYSQVTLIMDAMKDNFKISFIPFIPCILVIVMLAMGKPSVMTILVGNITAGLVAVFYQGNSLESVLKAFWGGYVMKGDVPMINSLLSRGGISSMFSTTGMFMVSFALVGMMIHVGILQAAVAPLVDRIRSRFGLSVSTILMVFLGNAVGCSDNFAYIFSGPLMLPTYKKMGMANIECTRTMGCSTMGSIIPWNMNAVIALQYLGVSALQYAPYYFLGMVMPILCLIFAATKFDVSERTPELSSEVVTEGPVEFKL